MTSSKVELLKTLQHLKRSVRKIQNDSPSPDGQGVTDSNTDASFNKEFRACLKELKVQRTEEAKKECNSLKKRKYFIERTVDIIDKISIDDVLRQYKHDYGNFFQYNGDNPKNSHHIRKSMLKILERKRNIDREQKDAIKELCKPYKEFTNLFCELCTACYIDILNKQFYMASYLFYNTWHMSPDGSAAESTVSDSKI